MIPIVERMRLRPPVQFFQALSHFITARFTSITKFTVWRVDSQEGQQAAFQIHDYLGGWDRLCHTMRASVQQNWVSSRCAVFFERFLYVEAGKPAANSPQQAPPRFYAAFLFAARSFAHLARCAAAIFLRADADIVRLAGADLGVFPADCDCLRMLAHRARCASAILRREAADTTLVGRPDLPDEAFAEPFNDSIAEINWFNFSNRSCVPMRSPRSSRSALSKFAIVTPGILTAAQLYRTGMTRGSGRGFWSTDETSSDSRMDQVMEVKTAGLSGRGISVHWNGDKFARIYSKEVLHHAVLTISKSTCISLSSTGPEGLSSLNRISWSCAHLCKNTSVPRPPPPIACMSVRSKTTTRAFVWDVTASRSLKAASLRTNRPAHSTIAVSPRLSMRTLGIIPPS